MKTHTERMNDFADACYSMNTRQDLVNALQGKPDQPDMAEWDLSSEQWQSAIRAAIAMFDEDMASD